MNKVNDSNILVFSLLNIEVSFKCLLAMVSCIFSIYCIFSFFQIIYLKMNKYISNMKDSKDIIHVISIDGNIGSGKSTLIKILKKYFINDKDIYFVDEPVNEWINVSDHHNNNILDQFYKNKNRWSYTFQNFAFITRMHQLLLVLKQIKSEKTNKSSHKFILSERSTETDKNVFAKMLYDSGDMDELEFCIYTYWYNKIIDDYPKIDNIIYLNTCPEVSYERIKTRDRAEENIIPQKYIEDVHKYHEKWLIGSNLNVCKLNCSKDFESDESFQKVLIDEIKSFINNIKSDN